MKAMLLRSVDNPHKDGRFVDDLQDEVTALRREVQRLRAIVRHRRVTALKRETPR